MKENELNPEYCKTSPFDAVKYLTDEQEFSSYLEISFEENGIEGLKEALIDIARAKIINDLAKKTGLPRKEVYKKFIEGNEPTMDFLDSALNSVLKALSAGFVFNQHHPQNKASLNI